MWSVSPMQKQWSSNSKLMGRRATKISIPISYRICSISPTSRCRRVPTKVPSRIRERRPTGRSRPIILRAQKTPTWYRSRWIRQGLEGLEQLILRLPVSWIAQTSLSEWRINGQGLKLLKILNNRIMEICFSYSKPIVLKTVQQVSVCTV